MKNIKKSPLMLLPLSLSKRVSPHLLGIGRKLYFLAPGIEYDLEQTDLSMSSDEYTAVSLLNSLFYFILFIALLFSLSLNVGKSEPLHALFSALGYSLLLAAMMFYVLMKYPRIMAGKKAEQIDRHLIFALKDMLLQLSSGVSLYNSMINISKSKYGIVSEEFSRAAKHISVGKPMIYALETMAMESKSGFLKRTIWQLVSTMKAGASLEGALRSLISDLTIQQRTRIKNYSHDLNLWSLVYMLFAVAVPTIGVTLMVILSSFAGFGISKSLFILLIIMCFFVQIIIIGLVKTRRPIVTF